MKRERFFAVVTMSPGPDFVEAIEGLFRLEDRARGTARLLANLGNFARVRVKPVLMTPPEVLALVEKWGRIDSRAGEPRADADLLPEPYRTAYLRGYNAGQDAGRIL